MQMTELDKSYYLSSEVFRKLVCLANSSDEVERDVYIRLATGFSAEFKAKIEDPAMLAAVNAASLPRLD